MIAAAAAGLPGGVEKAAAVLVALPAIGVLAAPTARARAWSTAAALVLTPAVLLAEVWDTAAFAPVRAHLAPAFVAGLFGVAAVLAGAALLRGRPVALAVALVVALPFRVPIRIGGETANLLVPLYAVIAAGTLAALWDALGGSPQALLRGRRPAAPAERTASEPDGERPGALRLLLAASIGLYALQAVYSADPAQALRNLVFFYVPFALLFALVAALPWSRRLVEACAAAFVGLALLFAMVGFAEAAVRAVPWNAQLAESNAYNAYFRVNSLFYDPNVYGRFLVVVLVFAATAVAWTRTRRDVLVLAGLIAVLWLALLTTLSESSLGALLVGLGALTAVRGHARAVLAAAAALAVVGVFLLVAAPSSVRLPGGDGTSLRKATSGRTDLVSGGADLFAHRPVAGWGAGAFQAQYRRLRGLRSSDALSASHTIPVTVAAEQGLVGLALYVALLAAAAGAVLGAARRAGAAGAAVAAAFAALVFHTLVYAAFLEDPLAWGLLAAAVALPATVAARAPAERAAAREPASAPA